MNRQRRFAQQPAFYEIGFERAQLQRVRIGAEFGVHARDRVCAGAHVGDVERLREPRIGARAAGVERCRERARRVDLHAEVLREQPDVVALRVQGDRDRIVRAVTERARCVGR